MRVGNRTGPDMDQFKDIVAHSDGQPLEVVVERAGETKAIKVTGQRGKAGVTLIGLPYYQDMRSARFVVTGRRGRGSWIPRRRLRRVTGRRWRTGRTSMRRCG